MCSATRRADCRTTSCRDVGALAYTIAGSGTLESLNVASAVNLCAYELTREDAGGKLR